MNMCNLKTGGFELKRLKEGLAFAGRAIAHYGRAIVKIVGVYLDDLLLIGAGVCLVGAAGDLGGRAAALAVAGVWCAVYAVVVARSRGGRK